MFTSTAHQNLYRSIEMAAKKGYSTRAELHNAALARYWGKQYANLPAWNDASKPFDQRAPRIVLRLEKLFVDTVNSYLFGEMRSPTFTLEGGEDAARAQRGAQVADLYTQSGLRALLTELGRLGLCCSSAAIGFHFARGEGAQLGRFFCEVIQTGMCKPVFGRDDRAAARAAGVDYDDLLSLDEYWLTLEDDESGQAILWRHRRTWTTTATIEYKPVRDSDASKAIDKTGKIPWSEDKANSVTHDLGFVPVEWFANGGFVAGDIDGFPLVDEAEWDAIDAVNYTFSQTHRAIQYNQDPWLVFKNAKVDADSLKKGGGRTLSLNADRDGQTADAALLEMAGSGQTLGLSFVDKSRSMLAQICQVVLHEPGTWSGALSGVALERLLAPMLVMVSELRGTYGAGLARLIRKMLAAEAGGMSELGDMVVTTAWGPLIDPTESEAAEAINNAITALDAGLVTFDMAVAKVVPFFGREDAVEVVRLLQSEGTTQPATPGQAAAPTPAAGGAA